MGVPAKKTDRQYTYGEYRQWPEDEAPTVVQPDIVLICDAGKLRRYGCYGGPEWVIKVLSPDTSRKDMLEKLRLYELHGAREYWIGAPGAPHRLPCCR
jgi:Uma2 family endonuclease